MEKCDAGTGVTEAQILALVRQFYTAARADDSLGPLFRAAVTEWDSHIQTVADFWSHVLLGTSRYNRHPFPLHGTLESNRSISTAGWNCSRPPPTPPCPRMPRQRPRPAPPT